MKTKNLLTDVLGWYGVIAILAAYAFLTWGIVTVDQMSFHLLNLTGSLGIIASSTQKRDWQADVLNIVFALIALVGIIGIFLR